VHLGGTECYGFPAAVLRTDVKWWGSGLDYEVAKRRRTAGYEGEEMARVDEKSATGRV
jgi:hypothetical protein